MLLPNASARKAGLRVDANSLNKVPVVGKQEW